MSPIRYYSTADAAEATSFSRSYIHLQIQTGKLRAVNVAEPGARKRYRISEADLKAFMERYAGAGDAA